jgi:hypothetical protein
MRHGVVAALVFGICFAVASGASAGVADDALCKDKKAKATGGHVASLLKAFGKNLKVPNTAKLSIDVSKAQSKITKKFTKAEFDGAGDPKGCQTTGDVAAIEAKCDLLTAETLVTISPVCGDGIKGGAEQCDGSDDSACPGLCLGNCLCAVCDDGDVNQPSEQCDEGPGGGPCCTASCLFRPATTNCDDGLLCNGTDACDGANICVHSGDPCPGTECNTCQEATDSCFDPNTTACASDGIFCTGPERCDGAGGCVSTGDPCLGTQCNTCQEILDTCFDSPATGCNDGSICTVTDTCNGSGTCTGTGTVCGNGTLEAGCGEQCDGASDAACPGLCTPSCTCECPDMIFLTGLPVGTCGRINDDAAGTGTDLTPYGSTSGATLACGTLYIGGGGSVQPPSPTPDGAESVFKVTDCSTSTAFALAAATSTDTGSNRNCTAPGCFFGPPLPIPNPASPGVSTCVFNSIAAAPAVGGTLDATSGTATTTLPLSTVVFVTGDLNGPGLPIQPCPKCVAGLCDLGPNAGGTCTTPTSLGTSQDCPPPGTALPAFLVDLSPLSTAQATKSSATGILCPPNPPVSGMGQFTAGCFGKVTCEYIEANGSAGGSLLLPGTPVATTLGSVFCIPASGSPLVNAVANLPGPGAVTLTGTTDLVP